MNYIIIIILILIILILLKYYNNIDNFSNINNKYVCLYAYYEKDEEYKDNLLYFLNYGLLDHVDYYFIINGECTVDIPNLNNIKILKRENKGYDFGAWAHCIHQLNKQYEYYIFLNTSVRGPYLTKEDINNNITWLDKFLVLFNNEDIKMVGTTINVLLSNIYYEIYTIPYKDIYKYDEPYTHIQSMFFILNNEGLNYLLSQDFFNENKINNYHDIYEIIIHYEIRLSQLILLNNWNINSIVPKYQNIDYRKQKEYIPHETPFTNEDLIFCKNILWYSRLIY